MNAPLKTRRYCQGRVLAPSNRSRVKFLPPGTLDRHLPIMSDVTVI